MILKLETGQRINLYPLNQVCYSQHIDFCKKESEYLRCLSENEIDEANEHLVSAVKVFVDLPDSMDLFCDDDQNTNMLEGELSVLRIYLYYARLFTGYYVDYLERAVSGLPDEE